MPFWENMVVMVNGREVSLGLANNLTACMLMSRCNLRPPCDWLVVLSEAGLATSSKQACDPIQQVFV